MPFGVVEAASSSLVTWTQTRVHSECSQPLCLYGDTRLRLRVLSEKQAIVILSVSETEFCIFLLIKHKQPPCRQLLENLFHFNSTPTIDIEPLFHFNSTSTIDIEPFTINFYLPTRELLRRLMITDASLVSKTPSWLASASINFSGVTLSSKPLYWLLYIFQIN